ncbi:MAG: universal stress protein [Propionibacteriaceae bacterium]|nr:universal stress protein [Propionibacteriaceae bacterium]
MSIRRVVVGWDGSDGANHALRWAARTAERLAQDLRVVMAARTGSGTTEAFAKATALVAEVAPGVTPETVVRTGHPVDVLREESSDEALVVVGTRGHSRFTATMLGSVSNGLSQHTPGPVVIVRGTSRLEATDPVVVGVDGSETSTQALAFAAEFAHGVGAPLVAVAAWPLPWRAQDPMDLETALLDGPAHAEHLLTAALSKVRATYPDLVIGSSLSDAEPAAALVDAARDAQLLVVGSRGRGGFAGMLLGSISRTVLHHAPCPVAVVRPVS